MVRNGQEWSGVVSSGQEWSGDLPGTHPPDPAGLQAHTRPCTACTLLQLQRGLNWLLNHQCHVLLGQSLCYQQLECSEDRSTASSAKTLLFIRSADTAERKADKIFISQGKLFSGCEIEVFCFPSIYFQKLGVLHLSGWAKITEN